MFKNHGNFNLFILYRCMIQSEFNSTEWITAPNERVIDSCKLKTNFSGIQNCEKWSFDETYYGTTRATQVIVKNNILI